eukprot:s2978_g3.t1
MAPILAPAVAATGRRRDLHPKPIFDEPSLRSFLTGHGAKPVHMGRIWKHVTAQLRLGCPPSDVSLVDVPGLPNGLGVALAANFMVVTSQVVQRHVSELDGTMKLLIRLQDGSEVEAVVIHHTGEAEHPEQRQADRCGERDTLCVSSQVGCRLGCRFCATGTMGLLGNLWAGEIQEQLIHARMQKGHSDSVCNVVFMGMGEPLENYEAVSSAIRGLVDPMRFGLAPSSVTVSTVGSSPHHMQRLLEELPKIRLAVSLHAPNQSLREELVPAAKAIPIDKLLAIVDDHAKKGEAKRLRTVMVSYVLLKGVNDSLDHARELSALLSDRPVIVNLIPYNPFEGNIYGYEEPSPATVDEFLQVLAEGNIRVFERRHHGRDIAAACGQLAKLGGTGATGLETDIENGGCTLNKDLVRKKSTPKWSAGSEREGCEMWRSVLLLGAMGGLVALGAVSLRRWRR